MNGILKAQSGPFWDYWFTENEILQVKVVPLWVPLVLFGFVLVLFFFAVGLEGVFGAIVAYLIAYLVSAGLASFRRRALEATSIQDLSKKGRVKVRVPWESVEAVALEGRNLTMLVNKRKYRAKIKKVDAETFRQVLKSKIGEKFTSS